MSTEQRKNSYDDADLKQLIEEIEAFESEKASIMAEAAGKCSAIAKRMATRKKDAKPLGIPRAILDGALKMRKLERQQQEVSDNIPEDLAEMWVDASGQFSLFKPGEGEEAAPTAEVAAKKRAAAAKANQEQELKEGSEVLDNLSGSGKPN